MSLGAVRTGAEPVLLRGQHRWRRAACLPACPARVQQTRVCRALVLS
jgi:hypothetical protein